MILLDAAHRARTSRLVSPGETWIPPLWSYSAQPQQWGSPTSSLAPPGYTWSFAWESATFDLRPDLASRDGQIKQGYQIGDTAARLYLLVTGLAGSAFDANGLEVTATNAVQVFNAQPHGAANSAPAYLVDLASTDVSSDFYPGGIGLGTGRAAVVFSPPGTSAGGGEGYPIRYWRLSLRFQFFVPSVLPLPEAVPPSTLVLTAGMF